MQQCTPASNFSLFEELQILGPNMPKKNVNNKKFGKINIKFEMRIQQCTPVPNFSEFGEIPFLRPNLPKKNFRVVCQEKLNPRITYFK